MSGLPNHFSTTKVLFVLILEGLRFAGTNIINLIMNFRKKESLICTSAVQGLQGKHFLDIVPNLFKK